ncbi:MAG: DUF427 domain-containing protein [Actinomycetia bacterium]|nr:DUF427 domain-containing protein [Actinomycetes bacterium]
MAKATLQGTVIAESDDTVVVDGMTYFPREAVRSDILRPSQHTSVCGWKGTATYFDVVSDANVAAEAAFEYADPSEAAAAIRGRIAFWRDVSVTDS